MLRGRGWVGAIPASVAPLVQRQSQRGEPRSQCPGAVGEVGAATAQVVREPTDPATQPHQHGE